MRQNRIQRLRKRVLQVLKPSQRLRLAQVKLRLQNMSERRQASEARLVSERYSAQRAAAACLELVRGALDAVSVEYATLPALDGLPRVIAVKNSDRRQVIEALRTLVSGDSGPYLIHSTSSSGNRKRVRKLKVESASASAFDISRPMVAANQLRLDTVSERVSIQFWNVLGEGVPRNDGEYFIPGTIHSIRPHKTNFVKYFSPEAWDALQDVPGHEVSHQGTMLFEIAEPIDVVYTWVDGNDPAWRSRQQKALHGLDISHSEINETALSASRFVSHDELKYSLRSLAMYADWVRKIYVVTDGQTPSWLDISNPRIQIVDHAEIFADTTALPVFNSHAIESQLHHIEGLADRYLYLNDDVFFGRPTTPSLFFHSNGIAKFFLSKAVLDLAGPSPRDLPVLAAAKNNREFISKRFDRVITQKFKHTPHPQLRSVLTQLEADEPAIFDRVMRSRVRHPDDLSIASALHHYYAYCQGLAVESDIAYAYVDLARPDLDLALLRLRVKHHDFDALCLNSTSVEEDRMAELHQKMTDLLEDLFPVASEFEKSESS